MSSKSCTAISVRGLSKAYTIAHNAQRATTLGEALIHRVKNPLQKVEKETFWALQNINFDVQKGDVVGVIGRNGAGKSTLLKILSQIVEPTSGQINLFGRTGSLLEVGTGFHPELTGRENIYLNGAILGMSRQEIARQFDAIVDFAEVEKFLDTPVKRYSSGMYVRLAFSVAAHLNPEILVVDEVLAVGDAAFQQKCLGKMEDVASSGRTVLFASHNIGVVSTLTKKCLYLKRGRVEKYDLTQNVIGDYIRDGLAALREGPESLSHFRRDHNPNSSIHITAIRLDADELVGSGSDLPSISMGKPYSVVVELEAKERIQNAAINIMLKTLDGQHICHLLGADKNYYLSTEPGKMVVRCKVEGLILTPGDYCVLVGIHQDVNTIALDVIQDYPLFSVLSDESITHWPNRPWGFVYCDRVSWT